MTTPQRPTPPTGASREAWIDAYIDVLRRDLNAPPPPGVDEETARAARALVDAEMRERPRLSHEARTRMWQQTLNNMERGDAPKDKRMLLTMKNSYVQPQNPLRAQVMTFAAMIAVVAFAVVLLARLDYAPLPPDDDDGFVPALAGSEEPDEQQSDAQQPDGQQPDGQAATATPFPVNPVQAAAQAGQSASSLELCAMMLQLGDFDGAVTTCRTALAADDQNPDVWATLGHAQYLQRSYAEAVRSFEICRDLGGTDVRCDYLRGMAYGYLGQCDPAWESLYGLYRQLSPTAPVYEIVVAGLNNLQVSCPQYEGLILPAPAPTMLPPDVSAIGVTAGNVTLLPISGALNALGEGDVVLLEGTLYVEAVAPDYTIVLSDATGSVLLEFGELAAGGLATGELAFGAGSVTIYPAMADPAIPSPAIPSTSWSFSEINPVELSGSNVVIAGTLTTVGNAPLVQVYSVLPADGIAVGAGGAQAIEVLPMTATPLPAFVPADPNVTVPVVPLNDPSMIVPTLLPADPSAIDPAIIVPYGSFTPSESLRSIAATDPLFTRAQAEASRLLRGAVVIEVYEQVVSDENRLVDAVLDNGITLYMLYSMNSIQSLEVYAVQWVDGRLIPMRPDSGRWLEWRSSVPVPAISSASGSGIGSSAGLAGGSAGGANVGSVTGAIEATLLPPTATPIR